MATLKIFSIYFRKNDFIQMQFESLKKYCETDFEFYVCDNNPTTEAQNSCRIEAEKCGCNYILIKEQKMNMGHSGSHSQGLQYVWDNYMVNDLDTKWFLFLDFDMFCYKNFNISKYNNYDIVGNVQGDGSPENPEKPFYIFPAYFLMKNKSIKRDVPISFFCGKINDKLFDTGAYFYFYLQRNPKTIIGNIKPPWEGVEISNEDMKKFGFDVDFDEKMYVNYTDCFIHYGAGSNWNGKAENYHDIKMFFIKNILKKNIAFEKFNPSI